MGPVAVETKALLAGLHAYSLDDPRARAHLELALLGLARRVDELSAELATVAPRESVR